MTTPVFDDNEVCDVCGTIYYGEHICYGKQITYGNIAVQFMHLKNERPSEKPPTVDERLAEGFELLHEGGGWDGDY